MKLFAYGSLMNERSAKRTASDIDFIGPVCVEGYRRVFDFKSPYRKNPETNRFSSVLNLRSDPSQNLSGILYELKDGSYGKIAERERGYDLIDIMLTNGQKAVTFISTDNDPYEFVFDDPIQLEYFEICIFAARRQGEQFLLNFLQTTFINGESLTETNLGRKYLP